MRSWPCEDTGKAFQVAGRARAKALRCLRNTKEARVAGAECARGKEIGEGNLEDMGKNEFYTERSREPWEGLK